MVHEIPLSFFFCGFWTNIFVSFAALHKKRVVLMGIDKDFGSSQLSAVFFFIWIVWKKRSLFPRRASTQANSCWTFMGVWVTVTSLLIKILYVYNIWKKWMSVEKKNTGIGTFAARTALYWAIYFVTFRTPNFRKSLKLFVQPLAKK